MHREWSSSMNKTSMFGDMKHSFLTEVWHIAASGCLKLHVPCLEQLWDGQKDCPDVEQVWCSMQKNTKKMHHCMLLGLSW